MGYIKVENFFYFVRPSGIEPLTYSLEGCCSIRLSYGRRFNYKLQIANCKLQIAKYKFSKSLSIINRTQTACQSKNSILCRK